MNKVNLLQRANKSNYNTIIKYCKSMKNSSVWSIGKYTIKNGKIFNKEKEIKKTVKGYTVGFWLNKRFRSLAWINKNAVKEGYIKCPF